MFEWNIDMKKGIVAASAAIIVLTSACIDQNNDKSKSQQIVISPPDDVPGIVFVNNDAYLAFKLNDETWTNLKSGTQKFVELQEGGLLEFAHICFDSKEGFGKGFRKRQYYSDFKEYYNTQPVITSKCDSKTDIFTFSSIQDDIEVISIDADLSIGFQGYPKYVSGAMSMILPQSATNIDLIAIGYSALSDQYWAYRNEDFELKNELEQKIDWTSEKSEIASVSNFEDNTADEIKEYFGFQSRYINEIGDIQLDIDTLYLNKPAIVEIPDKLSNDSDLYEEHWITFRMENEGYTDLSPKTSYFKYSKVHNPVNKLENYFLSTQHISFKVMNNEIHLVPYNDELVNLETSSVQITEKFREFQFTSLDHTASSVNIFMKPSYNDLPNLPSQLLTKLLTDWSYVDIDIIKGKKYNLIEGSEFYLISGTVHF